jgi:hypothetical protein
MAIIVERNGVSWIKVKHIVQPILPEMMHSFFPRREPWRMDDG